MSTPALAFDSPPPASSHWRTLLLLGLVILLHLGVLAAFLHAPIKPADTKPEPQIVVAQLISAVATPAPPPPAAAVPTPVVPPRTPPKPQPPRKPTPVVHQAPTKPVTTPLPAPAVAAPSPPAPAPPPPAAPAPPTATISSAQNPMPATNVPKNVSHISCSLEQPAYPQLSRERDETGTTLLTLTVDTQGRIESAAVKKSSGFTRLDNAARAAALASHCQPYMEGGRPILAAVDVPFNFNLDD